jgi:hypothetical protein
MKPPEKIYLQIGDDLRIDEYDFEDLADVTWCIDKISDNDIEYKLVKKAKPKARNKKGYCTNCDNEIKLEYTFCWKCGAELDWN